MIMFWELKHSVIANADRQTVWEFVSNIDNLARIEGDAVESMTLDGPYQSGSKGTTKIRGQEPIHWRLAEVEPPGRNVTEMELTEAVLRFNWTYEELPDGRTRLSQHIVLEGPGAEAYVPFMEEHFVGNIPKGMERLAKEVARRDTAG
jgi:Polyketide cyclase / dehydrase and lipid transport